MKSCACSYFDELEDIYRRVNEIRWGVCGDDQNLLEASYNLGTLLSDLHHMIKERKSQCQ